MSDQRDHLKPRVIPGLVVLCVYLTGALYFNAMALRIGLGFWDQTPDTLGTQLVLTLFVVVVKLVLCFVTIALLALVRRSVVPYVGAATLLFCGPVGFWLMNVILVPFGRDGPIVSIDSPWMLIDLLVTLCGAVWLLKSRNVRDFFDHRLLARTFD